MTNSRHPIENVLWSTPAGETDALHECVLTSTTDKARIEKVKALASADGWHSFRVQTLDGTPPDFGSPSLVNVR